MLNNEIMIVIIIHSIKCNAMKCVCVFKFDGFDFLFTCGHHQGSVAV